MCNGEELDAQAAAHAAEVEALLRIASDTAAQHVVDHLGPKLATAEADRDAYRARIDAVRALCDDVIDGSGLVALVRAALDGA